MVRAHCRCTEGYALGNQVEECSVDPKEQWHDSSRCGPQWTLPPAQIQAGPIFPGTHWHPICPENIRWSGRGWDVLRLGTSVPESKFQGRLHDVPLWGAVPGRKAEDGINTALRARHPARGASSYPGQEISPSDRCHVFYKFFQYYEWRCFGDYANRAVMMTMSIDVSSVWILNWCPYWVASSDSFEEILYQPSNVGVSSSSYTTSSHGYDFNRSLYFVVSLHFSSCTQNAHILWVLNFFTLQTFSFSFLLFDINLKRGLNVSLHLHARVKYLWISKKLICMSRCSSSNNC